MKFIQLFRKELKLLLNNKKQPTIFLMAQLKLQWLSYFLSLLLVLSFITLSCGDKKPEDKKPNFSVSDSINVNNETKKLLGDNLKFVFTGNFDRDSSQEVAAGIELSENNTWGIKFVLLKVEDNKLVKKYETVLLDGSFKESLVKKIKFPTTIYNLIYYSSQDYYWGSGGGEVFSYVVDFAENQTFYAHLYSESRGSIELFLSKNITDPEIKKFFLSSFTKDYPGLKLASEDVSLEF